MVDLGYRTRHLLQLQAVAHGPHGAAVREGLDHALADPAVVAVVGLLRVRVLKVAGVEPLPGAVHLADGDRAGDVWEAPGEVAVVGVVGCGGGARKQGAEGEEDAEDLHGGWLFSLGAVVGMWVVC